MSAYRTARNIYRAIRNDTVAISKTRAKYAALALSITDGNGTMQITDSQVNGQGFTAKHGSTVQENFDVLRLVVQFLDCGGAPPPRTQGRFR